MSTEAADTLGSHRHPHENNISEFRYIGGDLLWGVLVFRMLLQSLRLLRTDGSTRCLGGLLMRSDLVFGAMANVPNRFLLTKLASQAVRRLHRPNTRIQETANDVFVRFQRANPMAEKRDSEQHATVRLRSAA